MASISGDFGLETPSPVTARILHNQIVPRPIRHVEVRAAILELGLSRNCDLSLFVEARKTRKVFIRQRIRNGSHDSPTFVRVFLRSLLFTFEHPDNRSENEAHCGQRAQSKRHQHDRLNQGAPPWTPCPHSRTFPALVPQEGTQKSNRKSSSKG